MREIRFRAWDKLRKVMLPVAELSWEPPDLVRWAELFDEKDISYYTIEIPAEGEIMQYTGLCDRNGKEIWEGDILKWIGLVFQITVDDFHGYRFMFGKDTLCKAYAMEGEVIGNIFENGDLLEVKP